jgi:hypothetical protein
MALLGRGVTRGDPEALDRAAALLEGLVARTDGAPGANGFREELDLARRWRAHLDDPAKANRPALPFDGMR